MEMDARMKVRDIREWENLKRRVELKWWESGLLALLFISAVGALVTVAKLVTVENRLLYGFIIAWCGLFILTLVACVEFLITKFRALRRMHELTSRQLDDIQESVKAIREYLEAREEAERPQR